VCVYVLLSVCICARVRVFIWSACGKVGRCMTYVCGRYMTYVCGRYMTVGRHVYGLLESYMCVHVCNMQHVQVLYLSVCVCVCACACMKWTLDAKHVQTTSKCVHECVFMCVYVCVHACIWSVYDVKVDEGMTTRA
jgi:hypothetical protein